MYNNGVSHAVAENDFDGVRILLRWLSFVPKFQDGPQALLPTSDSIDRDVEFTPSRVLYDPRWLIAGREGDGGNWESGFFDRGSWQEVLANWAQTVVCGRARLGGIPVGVVAVETRTVEQITPADPANIESDVKVTQQAGQVWFPDSAFKTAQCLRDFNREQLPVIIFANWRGFSGGMKDMFDEVLKYGSYIVDALKEYRQPVFIYLPPHAELRGGAWVVLDTKINAEYIEMYADERSRCVYSFKHFHVKRSSIRFKLFQSCFWKT